MNWSYMFMIIGFMLATYSVIANDSIQTLGTFLESNKKTARWKLATAASLIAVAVIVASRVMNGGDISRGRLATKGIALPEVFTIRHALAPLGLLLLTRYGIPVSTSLLILSVFATNSTIEKMVTKSMLGYLVAFIAAYLLWVGIVWLYDRFKEKVNQSNSIYEWYKKNINRTYLQRLSTGYLWSVWLMHDMANIAVYLPRQLHIGYLLFVLVLVVGGLFYIFWRGGGKIQDIVSSKTDTQFIKTATIIDFVYACVLVYFKELNSIPMSTTRVFVGLLAGREVALAHYKHHGKSFKKVFPMIFKDFGKVMLGLILSVALALLVGSVSI